MFMADLVRALDVPVVCQFIKPKYSKPRRNSPRGHGDFLQPRAGYSGPAHSAGRGIGAFRRDQRVPDERPAARGAASVKLVTLLDRQSARRVPLQPDYFGFLVDEAFLIGYGLGAVEQTNRNLPYLAAANASPPVT